MKPSSAKAKGRALQQLIRDDLRKMGEPHGLVDEDIESRGMGQNGVDVILSPAAQKIFPLDVEAKNQESLNVVTIFWGHFKKYAQRLTLKILVHKKNHTTPLVTLRWADFLELLALTLPKKESEPTQ